MARGCHRRHRPAGRPNDQPDRREHPGARRLQTILERVLDELSFEAPEVGRHGEWQVEITADYVERRVAGVLSDPDLSGTSCSSAPGARPRAGIRSMPTEDPAADSVPVSK